MHIENLLLTAQIKPSFLPLITPVSSSGYYNDWYFMCIQQRRKINCRIISANNTFLITFKIVCSFSHGIFQWASEPRSLWDLLSFCSVCCLVLRHKGGQVQLLSLNVPKVYRLTWDWNSQRDLEMQNFAKRVQHACLSFSLNWRMVLTLKYSSGSCCPIPFQYSVSTCYVALGKVLIIFMPLVS